MKKSLNNYLIDSRPWGGFEQFTLNEKTTVKILTLKPGKRFSLQKHKNRTEFWKVIDNPVKITIGKETFKALPGDEVMIPAGSLHRAQALKKEANILEIAFGSFKGNDITRIEDDFGRK